MGRLLAQIGGLLEQRETRDARIAKRGFFGVFLDASAAKNENGESGSQRGRLAVPVWISPIVSVAVVVAWSGSEIRSHKNRTSLLASALDRVHGLLGHGDGFCETVLFVHVRRVLQVNAKLPKRGAGLQLRSPGRWKPVLFCLGRQIASPFLASFYRRLSVP